MVVCVTSVREMVVCVTSVRRWWWMQPVCARDNSYHMISVGKEQAFVGFF